VTEVADSVPERSTAGTHGLDALGQVTDAVQAGAGLPEILRAAARALDSSLILIDRSATVLAVAARSPADERSLMRDGDDVMTVELKVADAPVGTLRMRAGERPSAPPRRRPRAFSSRCSGARSPTAAT
jgi:hypothetical protein